MSLFRRKKREAPVPVEGFDNLVRTSEAELEEMANALAMETYELVAEEEEEDGAAQAEAMAFFYVTKRDAATEEGLLAAGAVARVGYMARAAEWERLPTARRPEGWPIAALLAFMESIVAKDMQAGKTFWEALGLNTAHIVRSEPLDPAHDSEDGLNPMWEVPGMGGDFRSMLREKTMLMILTPGEDGGLAKPSGQPIEDVSLDEFRSIWKYGFLLRSFEEFFWDDYEPAMFKGADGYPEPEGESSEPTTVVECPACGRKFR